MIRHRTRVVHELSHVHLVRSYRFPRFLLTVSFIVTVLGLRLITHGIRDGWLPVLRNVRLGDLHIHHYVWGVLLLLGVGYLSVSYARPRWRHLLASWLWCWSRARSGRTGPVVAPR
ncbi:MAG: hypothetical protein KY456_10685 [Chloroflexi bacterium]|nr:hypothetical protein [Chloroflexota bacterium]